MEEYKKEFEDTKVVVRIRKSRKDRQNNGQKKKDNRTNNDLQNITHRTKDRATPPPFETGGELKCSERVGIACSNSATRRVTLVTNPVIIHK